METIIVQDADENILDILTLALQSDGFEVFPYMNCDEGLLNLINQVRPHWLSLIISSMGT